MKFDFNSLKVKTWSYFIVFTIIILIVLWLLEIIMVRSYYKEMKVSKIVKIGNEISKKYNSNVFKSTIEKYVYNNNLLVLICNENGDGYQVFNTFEEVNTIGYRIPNAIIEKMRYDLANEDVKNVNYEIGGDYKERLYYGTILDNTENNKIFLIITTPLPPIDPTIEILKNQLIIVTFSLVLLAFIIAFLFSSKISKPITNITKTAHKLANGDMTVVFSKGNFSEINELSNTLNYATKEISRVEELRKDLIANVSHDLRTPLTIIKFYGELIRDVSGNNEVKRNEHAELIIKESDKLTSLVNEILQLSKIQSERFELKLSEFYISDKVKEIVEGFKVITKDDGYSFETNIEEELMISGDESQIERVIYNLISNAVNYTGDDKIVKVNLKKTNDNVRFEVIDTGKGIPEEQIKNIWERYYKVKETHKRAIVGNGLGLSIVKNILNRHKAEFGVNSKINEGSVFWFEIKSI